MSFHEIRFPEKISYGSAGGPGFNTKIIESDSGAERRISRWQDPRRRYDVKFGIKTFDQLYEVMSFYIARAGPAYGFRYKDWLDFSTAANGRGTPGPEDVILGIGDGTTKVFQLKKEYVSGPTTRTRYITKPVDGSVVVAIDGTPTVSGWAVDTTTGELVFSTAPALDEIISWGGLFDVPVRFGAELDEVFSISLDDFNNGKLQSIPLIEIRDTIPSDLNEFSYGGACEIHIYQTTVINVGRGRVWAISAEDTGLQVRLPDVAGDHAGDVPTGAPHFYIVNAGSAQFDVALYDGTVLATLDPDQCVVAFLSIDGSDNKIWYVK